jgi:hypothetical protein
MDMRYNEEFRNRTMNLALNVISLFEILKKN